MKFRTLFGTTCISLIFMACGGEPETPLNSSNANTGHTNISNTNSANPLAATTPVPDQTVNNAPTLTPVYKAYCAATVKKDEAALRKVFSAESLKFLEEDMKAEGQKSLIAHLGEDVSNELCEVRNEQISGDIAVAEIRTNAYPNGIKFLFARENGEWKLTTKSPNVEAFKPTK